MTEAARYLRLPAGTLRSWLMGRTYPTQRGRRSFSPLIAPPLDGQGLVSFSNLVEAHVLKALRTEHGVPIAEVRKAIRYAESELCIERLLLRQELMTSGREVFLQHYGELVNLSRSGQLAMAQVLEAHLKRVEWDRSRLPVRLFPFVRTEGDGATVIAIDPRQAFGRPIVVRQGIGTAIIADRIDAGETVEELADDYGLEVREIEEAVVYERAA